METALLPMTEETARLLRSFREVRGKMERASARNELTEALCLLPPSQRAFDSSMQALRSRLAKLPAPEEATLGVPDLPEFPPIDGSRRVPMHVAGWYCGAVALALMGSFAMGFITGRS